MREARCSQQQRKSLGRSPYEAIYHSHEVIYDEHEVIYDERDVRYN